MKRGILAFLLVHPISALGQQKDSVPPKEDGEPAISEEGSAPLLWESTDTSLGSATLLAAVQGPVPASSQKEKSPQSPPQNSKPGEEITRPITAGSMVGYIDNAIVGSQLVIRFESQIQNLTPDLAEFLYPQCNCPTISTLGPGAGPPGLASNVNTQILHFYGEYAVNRRFSILAEVPLRWLQPQMFASGSPRFPNHGGLSDVLAGFKVAMLASPGHYVTLEVQGFFPSGNASTGLGTNHYSVQSSVLYYQRLTRRLSIESEFGELHPIGGSQRPATSGSPSGGFASDIIDYGVGPSYKLIDRPRIQFSPLIEFIGWRMLNGFVTGAPQCSDSVTPCSASGSNILNLKSGARITLGAHNSVYAGYGRSLTGLYWYLRVYKLEYRYSF